MEKKNTHGGHRAGAGRKPIEDKAFEKMLNIRVSTQQKATFTELGGAKWLRETLEEKTTESVAVTLPGFMSVKAQTQASVPYANYSVQAGFPSPAEDYIDKSVDFNELLIANEPATFVLRAAGESMIDAGIHPGDLLVVDRSRTPKNQDIVIMQINNEFTVKRLIKEKETIYLKAENASKLYADIYPDECDVWQTFGVVTHVIKSF